MELKQLEAKIEAILFTMGEAVEAERIAAALGHDTETIKRIIHNMMDAYEAENRGIQIIALNGTQTTRGKNRSHFIYNGRGGRSGTDCNCFRA